MIRVRFHGRGGHGVKTASRILGTAAFLAAREVQDSPVYGAERRGAAVASFTRIARDPIRERGVITRPTLIVVADATLLGDASAGVLAGQETSAAVFINSSETDLSLAKSWSIAPRVITLDLTSRALETLGHVGALSTMLAAASARLTNVTDEAMLDQAVREELDGTRLTVAEIESNRVLAREVFRTLEPLPDIDEPSGDSSSFDVISAVPYDGPWRGSPTILAPGNAKDRNTGTWRVERPVIDHERCTRCAICFVRCPDGAISLDEEGYPLIDYDHCKGCMICRTECPLRAITGVEEVRAW